MSGRSPEKSSRRLMAQAAKKKFGKVKPRTQKLIDKVIDRKSKRTREENIQLAKNSPFGGTSVLTDRGFETLPRSKGGKVMSGNELVASLYD
tara:strand:+ start:294 stop:569 length:276 start_codon:yes stop_codon:yes gene_type:complete